MIITILALLFVPLFISGIDLSDIENPTFSAGFFASAALFTVLAAIVGVVYFPFFWVRGGQTPGQRVFGIRVVRDQDGGPLSSGSSDPSTDRLLDLRLWCSRLATSGSSSTSAAAAGSTFWAAPSSIKDPVRR